MIKLMAVTNYREFGEQLLTKNNIYYTEPDAQEVCNHIKVKCDNGLVRNISTSLFILISK